MTFSFREVSLGEVCEIKQGRYLAPHQMEPAPTAECSVPVIGGNGVLGFTDQSTFPFPVPLVTCRGSKCGLMQWAEPPTWISNNAMAVYFKENQGDNFFLHQYLLNSSFDDVITGSAQPQITVTNLSLKQIILPDLQTQKSISSLMKNIEDQISTNHVLSKTLENIAQTIFKSWFIDFNPIKAKMAGVNPAGMDAATASLFPESMEESERGLIPKSWEIKPLGDVVDIAWGDTKTTKASYVSSGFKAYSAKGQDGFLAKYDYSQIGIVLSAIGANCGKTWLANGKWSCIKNTMRIIASPNYPAAIPYIYFLTNKPDFWERRGTAQPFIGQEDSRSLPILFPGNNLLSKFSDITIPIFDYIDKLTDINIILNKLRDSLLPRLISGELLIPNEMLAL